MLNTATSKEMQIKELIANISPQELQKVLEEVRSSPVSSQKVKVTLEMKRYVTSVEKNITNTLKAVKKLQEVSEPIPDEVWKEIEMHLNKVSLTNYKQNAGQLVYQENRGRPTANVIEDIPKKRGRPAGVPNKPKVEAVASEDVAPQKRTRRTKAQMEAFRASQAASENVAPKKRGRPAGVPNKPKVEAVASEDVAPKKRGRPAGVPNKPKVEAVTSEVVAPKKRGRPAGVPNKPKTTFQEQTSVENTEKKDISPYRQWEIEQAKKGHTVPSSERKGRKPLLVA